MIMATLVTALVFLVHNAGARRAIGPCLDYYRLEAFISGSGFSAIAIAELETEDGSNSDKNNKDGRICPVFIHTKTTVLDLMVCWRPKEWSTNSTARAHLCI